MVGPARRYEVRGLLGEGAFGAVYLAEATTGELRRAVAIKVLKPESAAVPGLVGRLRDEARLLSLIRHRAIVRVDELVELEGGWSVVMEYVEGCDVAQLVRRGPVPPRAAVAIAAEVANALHAAFTSTGPDGHPLRLVHRDIKPGNIRVTALGDVKLLDFGVARADLSTREAATTHTAFGTLPYMAPERFEGRDTQAGDVYALGVTLFEMLAGARPGRAPSDPDRQPPGAALAHAWAALLAVSPPLHALVARMMAPDPRDRPAPRDVARALGDLGARLPGEALEDWAAAVVPPLCAARTQAQETVTGTVWSTRPTPDPSRGPWAWVAAGAGAAVVTALAIVGVFGAGAAWWLATGPGEPAAEVVPVTFAPSVPVADTTVVAAEADAAVPVEAPPDEAPAKPTMAPRAPRRKVLATPTARVEVDGDAARVRLIGEGGARDAGDVPPGRYRAEVEFASGGTVTIPDVVATAGNTTRLRCDARFQLCRVE